MYYIDGHNLLGAYDRNGSNHNINWLTEKLRLWSAQKKQDIVLVFDNQHNFNILDYYHDYGRLKVYFSDPAIDQNGDDCLVRLLAKRIPSDVTVVTADRDLKDRLRIINYGNFLKPEDFIEIVERKIGNNKNVETDISKDEELKEAGIDEAGLRDELLSAFKKDK